MPVPGPGGVDNYLIFKAFLGHQGLENAFCQGRAADVAETDETDFKEFGGGHSIIDLGAISV